MSFQPLALFTLINYVLRMQWTTFKWQYVQNYRFYDYLRFHIEIQCKSIVLMIFSKMMVENWNEIANLGDYEEIQWITTKYLKLDSESFGMLYPWVIDAKNILVDFIISSMNNRDQISFSGRKLMPKHSFRKWLPPTRLVALKIKLIRFWTKYFHPRLRNIAMT